MKLIYQPTKQVKLPTTIKQHEELKAQAMDRVFTSPEIEELLESFRTKSEPQPPKAVLENETKSKTQWYSPVTKFIAKLFT